MVLIKNNLQNALTFLNHLMEGVGKPCAMHSKVKEESCFTVTVLSFGLIFVIMAGPMTSAHNE